VFCCKKKPFATRAGVIWSCVPRMLVLGRCSLSSLVPVVVRLVRALGVQAQVIGLHRVQLRQLDSNLIQVERCHFLVKLHTKRIHDFQDIDKKILRNACFPNYPWHRCDRWKWYSTQMWPLEIILATEITVENYTWHRCDRWE
jgi:hypothetical protein